MQALVADDVDLLVLGAGIAGVTAARRLAGRHPRTLVLEAAGSAGGVAGVFRVGDFRFDYGLHCFFTAFPQVEAMLDEVMDGAHQRWPLTELVWHDGGWRPYPVTRNLAAYPESVSRRALADLPASPALVDSTDAVTASEAAVGRCLTRDFVAPQLRKFWSTEPDRLPAAVARAGFAATSDEVRAGAVQALDSPPTRSWSYPVGGGFAAYVERLAAGLDIRYATRAVRIDPAAQIMRTSDGRRLHYRRLVSSIPLPRLLAMIDGVPAELVARTAALGYTSVRLVSLGVTAVDAPAPWVYDIDPRVPWFRATFPGEYSPGSVPDGLASVQTESYSRGRAPGADDARHADAVVASLRERGLLPTGAEVVCRDVRTLDHASTLLQPAEAPVVRGAIEWLASKGITTVGRYGRWDNAKFDVVMARTDELIGGRAAVACEGGTNPMAFSGADVLDLVRNEFTEVFGVPVDDQNFFELGGRSVDAARLSVRLQRALGRPVPLQLIFRNPQPSQLSTALAAPAEPPAIRSDGENATRASVDVWPVTGTQERVVLRDEEHRRTGKPPYIRTSFWCASIHAALDRDALQNAVDALVDRQSALRTTYAIENGKVVAHVHRAAAPKVEFLDFREQGADAAVEHATSAADTAFDRRELPRLRVICYDCGPENTLLAVIIDHIVADGDAISVAVADLAELYSARVDGRSAKLEPLNLTFGDWVARQQTPEGRRRRLELIGFWAPSVAENDFYPTARLPFTRSEPLPDTFMGARHAQRFPAEVVAGMAELARQLCTTPYAVQLASLYAHLHRITGASDITVLVPDNNRIDAEEERLVGWMATTMALRLRIRLGSDFRQITRDVHEMLVSAMEYRGVAFGEVTDAISGGRRTKPVEVIRISPTTPVDPPRFGVTVATEVALPFTSAGLGLSMWIREAGDELEVTLVHGLENYSEESGRDFLASWATTAAELAAAPEQLL